jgi:DNA-directed RNA polymerase subunit H (RpoH/RPB5)
MTSTAPNMPPQVADILIRSRATTLQILEERGYDTTLYKNVSPTQLLTLSEGNPRALDIFVPKVEGSAAPCDRAVVTYMIQDSIRYRIGTIMRDLFDEFGTNTIKKTDDILVILNEPLVGDVYDQAAIGLWQKDRVRVSFFHIKQLVVHPGRHVLVPPHRKLSDEEAKAEIARLHLTQKSQLPLIKFHDIQARVLGLVPGDIVEVMRPSPTAGILRTLRICAA